MSNRSALSEGEITILRIISGRNELLSTRDIDLKYSRLVERRGERVRSMLEGLEASGHIVHHSIEGSPRDHWELTEVGRSSLLDSTS
jgi:hypothetical protein